MEFTDEQFKAFRADANILFMSLQDKYGVEIKLGNITYSKDGFFNSKITVKNKQVNGLSFEQNQWNQHCNLFSLKKEWFGKVIVINGKSLRIAGLDVSKPKRSITLTDGKKNYVTDAPTIVRFFENIVEL